MNSGRGVFITTYFSFHDALIQAYTLPYVRIIRKILPSDAPIYLLTVEKNMSGKGGMTEQDKSALIQEGIIPICMEYKRFGLGLLSWIPVLWKCLSIVKSPQIGHVHGWCTPGGLFGYILSKLSGKPLVLDSFEPHAEVMVETGTWKESSLKSKILFGFEKRMAVHASRHIICTDDMVDYAKRKYGVNIRSFEVKPACVDLQMFHPGKRKNSRLLEEFGLTGKLVAVYAGKFGGLYLKQEVFDFFKCAYDRWGDRFRVLLLTSEPDKNIYNMCEKAGLPNKVVLKRFVSHKDVPDLLGLGDFGFAPYNPVPSRKHGAPIKVSEYLAMGLPVVITENIADDSRLIEDMRLGSVIHSLDESGYRSAIDTMDKSLLDDQIVSRARAAAETLRNFGIAEKVYRKIYAE
ncbi:MAG: glycosyltransferase [Bacteroidota bacterium]